MIQKFRSYVILIAISSMATKCRSAKKDIIDFNQFTTKNQTRVMAELSRKCLLKKEMLVTVNEKLSDNLIRYLHRSETTSLTSLARSKLFVQEWYFAAENSREIYYKRHYYRFLWKSGSFLVAASSPANLKEQLDILKKSRWWNSAGLFFSIEENENSMIERCGNAYDFLTLAWKYGLLNFIFLCQEVDETVSIYSYNPFSDFAPQPWQKNREVKGRQGHPWSLFKWEKYDGRRYTCEDIFFDKTTSLNGYPITVSALSMAPFLYFNKNKTGFEKYNGEDGWIMLDIWQLLNATIIDVSQSDQDATSGWIDDNGTFHGSLIDVSSGKVDISFNSMMLQTDWKITTSYPHSTANICFATKSRGTIPWLIGLGMIFDKWTMICVFAIFGVSSMIFGYFNKRRYASGFMNIFRVYVSSSFFRPPSLNGLRLILCSVFLVPVIFNSIIQGNILSLIRNPLNYNNIEVLEDLQSFGLHVEGLKPLQKFITQPEIRKSFVHVSELDNCLLKFYKNQPVACMSYCFRLLVKASYQSNFHVAGHQSTQYHQCYIAKPDWPLKYRFNDILLRLVRSGLTEAYRAQSFYEKVILNADDVSNDNTAVVLSLQKFGYVFIALGIAWVIATIVFAGELVIGRSKLPKISKTQVKPIKTCLRVSKISHLVSRGKLRIAGLCKD